MHRRDRLGRFLPDFNKEDPFHPDPKEREEREEEEEEEEVFENVFTEIPEQVQ